MDSVRKQQRSKEYLQFMKEEICFQPPEIYPNACSVVYKILGKICQLEKDLYFMRSWR
jgi:hypothetical protein